MTNITREKKEVLNAVANFSELARKQKWVARYDADSDEFSFSVPNLSRDTVIKYINDDVAFYFDNKDKIKGVFIEYYKNNFINHEAKEYKDLKTVVKQGEASDEGFVELTGSFVSKISGDLQEALQDSLVKSLNFTTG